MHWLPPREVLPLMLYRGFNRRDRSVLGFHSGLCLDTTTWGGGRHARDREYHQ